MAGGTGFLPVIVALCLSLLASFMTMLSYVSTRHVFHQRMVFVLTVFSVLYTSSYMVYMVGSYETLSHPLSKLSGTRMTNISIREQPVWLKITLVVAVTAEMIFIAWTGCISHYCVHNAKYRALLKGKDPDFNIQRWEMEVEKKYYRVSFLSSCMGVFTGVGYFSYKHGEIVSECLIGTFRITLGVWIFYCVQTARSNAAGHQYHKFASKALSSILFYYVLSQLLSIAVFIVRVFSRLTWDAPPMLLSMSWAMNDIFPFFNTFVWGANRQCLQMCLQQLLIPSESPWSERRKSSEKRSSYDRLFDKGDGEDSSEASIDEEAPFMKKGKAPLLPKNPTNDTGVRELASPVEQEAHDDDLFEAHDKLGDSRLKNAVVEKKRQSSSSPRNPGPGTRQSSKVSFANEVRGGERRGVGGERCSVVQYSIV
jgi:hypothetical protein